MTVFVEKILDTYTTRHITHVFLNYSPNEKKRSNIILSQRTTITPLALFLNNVLYDIGIPSPYGLNVVS